MALTGSSILWAIDRSEDKYHSLIDTRWVLDLLMGIRCLLVPFRETSRMQTMMCILRHEPSLRSNSVHRTQKSPRANVPNQPQKHKRQNANLYVNMA